VQEIEDMFKYLSSLEVDGHTISPGYDYDAAKKDMVKRLGKDPKEFFLTRNMTRRNLQRFRTGAKRSRFSARRCIRNSSPANAS
jgi:hypothetical protein